jgi:hypothetical protein
MVFLALFSVEQCVVCCASLAELAVQLRESSQLLQQSPCQRARRVWIFWLIQRRAPLHTELQHLLMPACEHLPCRLAPPCAAGSAVQVY